MGILQHILDLTETFFHSLKVEWIYGEAITSRHETVQRIREYIEVFYNRQRLHSSIGYLSPQEFERQGKLTFQVSA